MGLGCYQQLAEKEIGWCRYSQSLYWEEWWWEGSLKRISWGEDKRSFTNTFFTFFLCAGWTLVIAYRFIHKFSTLTLLTFHILWTFFTIWIKCVARYGNSKGILIRIFYIYRCHYQHKIPKNRSFHKYLLPKACHFHRLCKCWSRCIQRN